MEPKEDHSSKNSLRLIFLTFARICGCARKWLMYENQLIWPSVAVAW